MSTDNVRYSDYIPKVSPHSTMCLPFERLSVFAKNRASSFNGAFFSIVLINKKKRAFLRRSLMKLSLKKKLTRCAGHRLIRKIVITKMWTTWDPQVIFNDFFVLFKNFKNLKGFFRFNNFTNFNVFNKIGQMTPLFRNQNYSQVQPCGLLSILDIPL